MNFNLYTISKKGFFNKSYEIYEDEILVYRVLRPSFFKIRDYLFLDKDDNLLMDIHHPLSLFTFTFNFSIIGGTKGTLKKKALTNNFSILSNDGDYAVKGNFFSTEYTIVKDKNEVAKVSRKLFRRAHAYGIAIKEGNDDVFILGILIAIIIIRRKQKNA